MVALWSPPLIGFHVFLKLWLCSLCVEMPLDFVVEPLQVNIVTCVYAGLRVLGDHSKLMHVDILIFQNF